MVIGKAVLRNPCQMLNFLFGWLYIDVFFVGSGFLVCWRNVGVFYPVVSIFVFFSFLFSLLDGIWVLTSTFSSTIVCVAH